MIMIGRRSHAASLQASANGTCGLPHDSPRQYHGILGSQAVPHAPQKRPENDKEKAADDLRKMEMFCPRLHLEQRLMQLLCAIIVCITETLLLRLSTF